MTAPKSLRGAVRRSVRPAGAEGREAGAPPAAPDTFPDSRARVFISYSRRDLERADALRLALGEAGFEAYLDQHDIAPGEPWKERLSALIASAEKVVFLISPASVRSEICDWEVNHAERLGKAVLPVIIGETPLDEVPERLKRLNFVFMRDGAEREARLPDLIEALRIDLAWEREKSRIGDLATGWEAAGRLNHLLLAGNEAIQTAERWRDAHPPTSPPPTDLHRTYIDTSRQRHVRRQRLVTAGAVAVAVAATILGLFAWQQRQEAIAQRNEALANQSLFLAEQAEERMAAGDHATAMLLALAGLPDRSSEIDVERQRPVVAQARRILHSALQRNRERAVIRTGSAPVADVAVDPADPERIATASSDGSVAIWDAATGGALLRLGGHGSRANSVAFDRTGQRLVTTSDDGTLRLWDAATGAALAPPLSAAGDYIGAAFSPGGEQLVAVSANAPDRVQLWNAAEGGPMTPVPIGGADVFGAAFSPGGEALLVASSAGVELIGLNGGDWRDRLYDAPAREAVFSPDGRSIMVVGERDDSAVLLVDRASGERTVLDRRARGVTDATFSPDGGRIALASSDGSVRVVERERGAPPIRLVTPQLFGERSTMNAVDFAPDGERLVTGSSDGTVRVWDARTVRNQIVRLAGARPLDLAIGEEGWVVAGTSDGALRLWSRTTAPEPRPLAGEAAGAYAAALSADASRLAALHKDGAVRVWDPRVGALLPPPAFALAGEPEAVALSRNGARLAVADERAVHLWELEAEAALEPLATSAEQLAFGAEPDALAVLAGDTPAVWDVIAGTRTDRCEGVVVGRVAFSPDGRRLACLAGNGVLIVKAEGDGSDSRVTLSDRERVFESAAFSADGRQIVTLSRSAPQLRLWNAETGDELARFEEVLPAGVNDRLAHAAFAPEGDEVVAVSALGALGRWRVFPSVQALVEEAKRAVPRCPTPRQREGFALGSDVLSWCNAEERGEGPS